MPKLEPTFSGAIILTLSLTLGAASATAQPLSLPSQVLTPPSGRGPTFGTSVAISGTTLVVGDPGDDQRGAVFVYEFRRGTWTLVTRLTGTEVLPGDAFGAAVAIDDATIVVGAPGDDTVRDASGQVTQTVSNKGAAYLFRRTGATWAQQARLDRHAVDGVSTTPLVQPGPDDNYGAAVGVTGDVVLVGAPQLDNTFVLVPDTGAVFVYERADANWTFAAEVFLTSFGRPSRDVHLGATIATSSGAAAAGGAGSGANTVMMLRRLGGPTPWIASGPLPTWFVPPQTTQDGVGLSAKFSDITNLLPMSTGVRVIETATLRTVTSAGQVSTLGSLPAATNRTFESPSAFVSGVGGKQLFKGDLSGTFTFLAGNPTLGLMDGTGTTAGFGIISAVAPDGQGNYYVADLASIRKVTSAGVVSTVAGLPGVVGAEDGPNGIGRLGTAQSLVFDPSSQLLYIADRTALRVMALDGTLTTLAGSITTPGVIDGTGAAARFTSPGSLVLATGGGVWLLDGAAIRRMSSAGVVTTLVGAVAGPPARVDGAPGVARFAQLTTLGAADDGTLYVADSGLLRRIATDGTVVTVAGSLPAPFPILSPAGARVALGRGLAAVAVPDGDAPLRPAGEGAGVVWVSTLSGGLASDAFPAYPPAGAEAFGSAVAFSGSFLFAADDGASGGKPLTALRFAGDRWSPAFQFVPQSGALTGFGDVLAGSDRFLAAATPGTSLASTGVVFVFDLDSVDTDTDGLPDRWEERYGLDPAVTTGADGPDGDPDGDGTSNAAELAAHTHPRGVASATRFFAEGARTAFFVTDFAIANPGTTAAEVLLRYAGGDGTVASTPVTVPARQSRTIRVPLGDVAEFATRVESDTPVVVDRLMSWDADTSYGSHGERAIASPATTWYFAEGATHSGFDLFYLLYNPSQTTASVSVRYLRASGDPLEKTYDVGPGQRFNIWVNLETFAGQALLGAAEVSARISVLNGIPIIAERAMYRTAPDSAVGTPGALFAAGHESAGITAPAASWFFAEGATNDFFDLFVLLANPGDQPSTIRARFLLGDGQTFTREYVVQGNSRFNIWVDRETFDGVAGTPLANVGEVSTTLDVIDGPPIVAERAMWWPGPTAATWVEAHNSPGATTTAATWVAAAGQVGTGTDTYYLLANPGESDAEVTLTLLFDDGTPETARTYTVGARSRFTVPIRNDFPAAIGTRFSAVLTTAPTTPIVVEWAVYRDALGQPLGAGANALATPWP